MVQRCRTPCRSHQTAMTGAPHSGQTFRVQREFTTISWAAKITIPRNRDAGDQITAYLPNIREAAQINRAFVRRAVRYLVNEAGIRQLIDIGTGLPTMGNVHEVAMAAVPGGQLRRAHPRHRGFRSAGARRGPGLRRGDHAHVRPQAGRGSRAGARPGRGAARSGVDAGMATRTRRAGHGPAQRLLLLRARGPQAVAAHGRRITTVRSVVVMVLSRPGIYERASIKWVHAL